MCLCLLALRKRRLVRDTMALAIDCVQNSRAMARSGRNRSRAPASAMRRAASAPLWPDRCRGLPCRPRAKRGRGFARPPPSRGQAIGAEAFGVDRPVEHERSDQALAGEAREKRRRLPMAVRRMAEGARASIGPGVTARHRRRCPGLVQKDQSAAQAPLSAPPRRAPLNDVRAILFAGAHGFF